MVSLQTEDITVCRASGESANRTLAATRLAVSSIPSRPSLHHLHTNTPNHLNHVLKASVTYIHTHTQSKGVSEEEEVQKVDIY